MAAIVTREKKNGSKSHTASNRIRKKGQIVYTETKTFSHKRVLKPWATKREVNLKPPGTRKSVADLNK